MIVMLLQNVKQEYEDIVFKSNIHCIDSFLTSCTHYVCMNTSLSITKQKGGTSSYIAGDDDPANFSYSDELTMAEALSLIIRNSKAQKAIVWVAGEMIRERVKFDSDKMCFTANKFGIPYPFKTFSSWLEWTGYWQECLKALIWALGLGDSILVFYDGNEVAKVSHVSGGIYGTQRQNLLTDCDNYNSCKAFHPELHGRGYTIVKTSAFFNEPEIYRIKDGKNSDGNEITYYITSDRVVSFKAPQLTLEPEGTSRLSAIGKDCIGQEQIKRSMVKIMRMLSSGIMAIKANNKTEKEQIKTSIGDSLSSLRRVYFKNPEELDNLFKLIIPDFKVSQITEMDKPLNKSIATGAMMSESTMDGADEGAIRAATQNTFLTYTFIKTLQTHFTRAMETAFYKFGHIDTVFEWNDPTPVESIVEENADRKGINNTEKENGNGSTDSSISESESSEDDSTSE